MDNPDGKICRDCYFYEKQGEHCFCMRYPPTKGDVAIDEDCWCGEFARNMMEKENE